MNESVSAASKKCPVCNSGEVLDILSIKNVPAHCNLLWGSKEEALNCPKGNIRLVFCNVCGHIFNQDFKPVLMEYTQSYENSLHFSPRFQAFADGLIKDLTEKYDLYNKDIIEIGCGKGDFLKMICKYGMNRGYGFDKSFVPDDSSQQGDQVTFIQDFYSQKYAHYPSDLVLCRHVLEHIPDPNGFLEGIHDILQKNQNDAALYFEVPNILYTLRDLGIWDLIYEHCSYYSATSLTRLFQNAGLAVNIVDEKYQGQFLGIEAYLKQKITDVYKPSIQVRQIKTLVGKFSETFNEKIKFWNEKLDRLYKQNKKIVAWGGGSKGVTFLNFLNTTDRITGIVDINPRKQGKYVAGTGQIFIEPELLKELKPDIVIAFNPLYQQEIGEMLKNLDLDSELLVA